MTITQLEYIIALEKHKNFVVAAEACHVSQPALSMQVRKLEELLGVQIFVRKHQNLKLTEAGEIVYQHALKILTEVEATKKGVRNIIDLPEGKVSLGIIPTISPYLLPKFLKELSDKYPKIQIEVAELTTEQIVRRIEEGYLDVGLLATPITNFDGIEIPLYKEELMAYIAKDHSLIKKQFVISKEIIVDDLWLLEEGHCLRNQIENFCELKYHSSSMNLKTGSIETIIRLVDKFKGITLIPQSAALELNNEQRDQVKHFSAERPYRQVSLIHKEYFNRKAILTALKNSILNAIPAEVLSDFEGMMLPIN